MADIVSPEKRSLMMAGIRGKNTKPELLIRQSLHRLGFRYRIHEKKLPGKPDLVFRKYNAVLFINGCFWHGHDCALFKWPATRDIFWKEKIGRNQAADDVNMKKLSDLGWRIGVIWECAIRGKTRHTLETVVEECSKWLISDIRIFEIRSNI